MWAASESSASECATTPIATSAAMNATTRASVRASLRRSASPARPWACQGWACAIASPYAACNTPDAPAPERRRSLLSSAMAATAQSEQALAQRTTLVSLAAAALLVALKLGVGLATASLGLVSAGIESSGDVIAAVVTFFAVRLGGRPADREHRYGHRRAAHLGAVDEAAILLP